MNNIPQWYDDEEGRLRDDIYPFQKMNKIERRHLGKKRLYDGVKYALRKLPDGWSVKWKASRKRTFRVNHTTKTISLPFPAERPGLPALGSALYLAKQIQDAFTYARTQGVVPANSVKAWPFLYGSHFSCYYASMLPCGAWVSRQSKAMTQAGIQSAKEVLRFYQSPDAWRVPRYKAGSPKQWSRPYIDQYTINAIAHRKVLMDYLKVNDPAYRLPAIAKARLQKIQQPTTQP